MLATLLIAVPLVAAIVLWVAPLPRDWTAGLATLAALSDVGLWVGGLRNFDFHATTLQYGADQSWIKEIGFSYSVGFYGFQWWLTGLTVVVGAAAIAYGAWVGRERPRTYYAMMLLLIGSLVGVFASQDLLLFYIFFEAMLIPIYVLVGVWGGPGASRRP